MPKIPPNFFGIGFGVAGLAEAWQVTTDADRTPQAVHTVLLFVSAASWLAVLAAYLVHLGMHPHSLASDLSDRAAAPFLSLALITPMLLSAGLVYPHAHGAGTILVDACIAATVALGAWLTGDWIYRPLGIDDIHPGYFLPTVAGGLLAAVCAAAVEQRRLAETMFGLGLICWLVLGSIVMNRLFTRPMVAQALLPTVAIEVAPPAVASLAWFALRGAQIDSVAELFGGYGLLMALAQLRLLPAYVRLPFRASAWAFTFSWAAAATTSLVWLEVLRPPGYKTEQFAILAAVTLLVAGIGARTLIALTRHELLPPRALTEKGIR